MSQHDRVATLCREHLQSLNLAHTFNPAEIKSYIRKHKAAKGNAFLIALKTADYMIANYKSVPALQLEQYDPFFN